MQFGKRKIAVITSTAFIGCGLISGSAHAAVVAYEPFSYPVGGLAGQGPASGFTGTWSQAGAGASNVAAGSLSYSTLPTTGNQASLDNAQKRDTETLATPVGGTDGNTVWVSYLLQSPGANTQGADYMGLVLNGSASDVFFGYTGAAPTATSAGVGLGTATPTTLTPVGTQTQEPEGTNNSGKTLFLVAEVQYASGGDTVSLFINPSLSGGPGTAAATLSQATSIGTINAIALQGSGSGLYDEIRVGSSFADVSGGSGSIPEPTSLALLGLSGLSLLRRGRRSQV